MPANVIVLERLTKSIPHFNIRPGSPFQTMTCVCPKGSTSLFSVYVFVFALFTHCWDADFINLHRALSSHVLVTMATVFCRELMEYLGACRTLCHHCPSHPRKSLSISLSINSSQHKVTLRGKGFILLLYHYFFYERSILELFIEQVHIVHGILVHKKM